MCTVVQVSEEGELLSERVRSCRLLRVQMISVGRSSSISRRVTPAEPTSGVRSTEGAYLPVRARRKLVARVAPAILGEKLPPLLLSAEVGEAALAADA